MRKRYLVDRKYQIRLVIQIIILVIMATGVSAVATFLLANREVSAAFYLAHRDTWDLKELLLPVITGTSIVTFLLVSGLSTIIVVRESHRIVGPVQRLGGALNDLAEGRISTLGKMRRRDVLKGLDEAINTLSENLSRLDDQCRQSLLGLREECSRFGPENPPNELQIQQIRKYADEIEQALGFFQKG